MNALLGIALIIGAILLGYYLYKNPIPKDKDVNLNMIRGIVVIIFLIVFGIILILR